LILFSEKDANRKVVISFKARRYRVAMLPLVNQSAYGGVANYTKKALTSILTDLGFIIIPGDRVLDVLREKKINVDGDRAAAAIAAALGARQLIILSNVPGLLRDFPDEASLIPALRYSELEQALSFAEGRMKKKVLGASEAIAGGVEQVVFADARLEGPVRAAMAGRGTVISK